MVVVAVEPEYSAVWKQAVALYGAVADRGVGECGVELKTVVVVPHNVVDKGVFGMFEHSAGAEVAYYVAIDNATAALQLYGIAVVVVYKALAQGGAACHLANDRGLVAIDVGCNDTARVGINDGAAIADTVGNGDVGGCHIA